MYDIIYIIKALNIFYQSAHWRAQKQNFYQDHLLFGRLYEGLDEEVDSLVELLIGNYDDVDFIEPRLINERVQFYTPNGSTNTMSNLSRALVLEQQLIETIKRARKEEEISAGIDNRLCDISENHEGKIYLIKQTLRNV